MATIIGADIGHSAVKISAAGPNGIVQMMIPSIVTQAFRISDEAEAKRAVSETITVGAHSFFIGETARIQGTNAIPSGISENWIETDEHTALLLGALKALEQRGIDVESPTLVMGLPTSLYGRQKDTLKEIVTKVVPGATVRVLPQPMGPFQELMLTANGTPNTKHSIVKESWAVIEVGYFTSDFMLIQNGRWVERASGSCAGVRVAAEHMVRLVADTGITIDLGEADEALRTRKIKDFNEYKDVTKEANEAIEIIVNEVVETAVRLLESQVRKLDGVLIAGGGASLVHPNIKAKWPHAVLMDNARMSVAEGMRRFGLMIEQLG